MVFTGGLALYVLLAILFGFKSAEKASDGIAVAMVFPILHFSYGLGYLIGIFNFGILRKKPSSRSKALTRS